MKDYEKIDGVLRNLAEKYRKYEFGTTAPKAPWNPSGRRLWHATAKNGKCEVTEFTPEDLMTKLDKLEGKS